MLIKRTSLNLLKKTPLYMSSFHYDAPYNKRFQDKFRRAWNMEPLQDDITYKGFEPKCDTSTLSVDKTV